MKMMLKNAAPKLFMKIHEDMEAILGNRGLASVLAWAIILTSEVHPRHACLNLAIISRARRY